MTDANAEATHSGASAGLVSAEDPTAFGWLNTADHKRIGRLFIACSLVFALAGAIADLLVRFDLASSGGHTVLNADSFVQVFTVSRDALVLGTLIPLFLGIAIYVVPLQVGAPNVAFGRAAALSFWGWLVSAGVLVGAYIANGGPGGGFSDGVDLHLLAVAGLVISLLTGAICVAVTTLTMRAPGMYMDRTPPFAWSALVTASMLVVSLGVVLGQIVVLYIEHRYGPRFLGGNYGIWPRIDWMYRTPQLFIYVVPVLGVVAEVMLAAARRWVFEPLARRRPLVAQAPEALRQGPARRPARRARPLGAGRQRRMTRHHSGHGPQFRMTVIRSSMSNGLPPPRSGGGPPWPCGVTPDPHHEDQIAHVDHAVAERGGK